MWAGSTGSTIPLCTSEQPAASPKQAIGRWGRCGAGHLLRAPESPFFSVPQVCLGQKHLLELQSTGLFLGIVRP